MNLHRLRLPLPLRLDHLNAYLIEGRRGYALVDTGMATGKGRKALQSALAEHGVAPAALRELFITHLHPDHWGHAAWLGGLGVPVLMPRRDSENLHVWLTDPECDMRRVEAYRHRGAPDEVRRRARHALATIRGMGPPFAVDRAVDDGEVIELAGEPFTVLITPGHSPGHGCLLHVPTRTLLCGDHVLPDITPNVSWELGTTEDPLGDYRASLARVRGLDIACAWPAHGDPMLDLHARIDELLAHHDERGLRVLRSLEERPVTAYEVTRLVFDFGRLDSFEIWLALGETTAHLIALEKSGRVQILTGPDGLERYRPA
jgi:glyoxylase-like metal-dependent hydrolase (beta-lactamase superfamily II)